MHDQENHGRARACHAVGRGGARRRRPGDAVSVRWSPTVQANLREASAVAEIKAIPKADPATVPKKAKAKTSRRRRA
jgi:hypothetical protein